MTIRRTLLSFLAAGILAFPALAADPALLRLVPPDAAVVGGVNLEQAKGTPFGQFVLNQLQSEDAELRKLMEATGFDPRRDLREVVFAAERTKGPGRHNGMVAASGLFDPARIFAAAKEHGAVVTSYSGVDIVGGKEARSGGIAFLSSSLVVAGETDQLQAAIDRYKSGGAGPGAALAAKAAEWSGKADAWIVAAGSPAEWGRHVPAPQAGPMKAVPLDAIEQSAGGVKFGAAVTLSIEAVARTDKDAAALADIVRFLAGMVQLNRENPQAAELAALIDTMQLKTEARTVSLAISVPEEQLEKMIRSKQGQKGKAAERKRATI